MKTVLFVMGIGLVAPCSILAQASDVIRVKGGVDGVKAIPFGDRYQYYQFRYGRVLYHNGASAEARFNYNILLGEMQFIDPRGDTLALTKEPVVREVGIGNSVSAAALQQEVYLYDQKKGYLAIISDYGGVKLAVKQALKLAKPEKQSGYEQSSGTSAITSYQFYASGTTSVHKLDAKGDLLLIKGRTYFIVDQNNRFYPANKASLLKVFSKHREQITAYLTNNSINFNREEDLKKLLKYCNESI